MRYSDVNGDKLSMLGFGAMRIPQREDKSLDGEALDEMLAYAIEHGVNYFDTAYVYHGMQSEPFLAHALSKYPRDSYRFATKFPGHQVGGNFDPEPIFAKELEQCGMDYFDYYLLHNINESSLATYMDPRWDIVNYFAKQRDLGKIKHLGFSTHGSLDVMREFLDAYGSEMEFCQIQLNYVDWTLQDAKAKVDLLNQYGIPIIVMEPLRGGKLATLAEDADAKLSELRPDESNAAWGLRWVERIPGVKVILSGMSNMEQLIDNVNTFSDEENSKALSDSESDLLLDIASQMSGFVPCTACRYCVDHCPQGLDIPKLLGMYNDLVYATSLVVRMRVDGLDEAQRPHACLKCGCCTPMCPQSIEIPDMLADFVDRLEEIPSWAEVCAARNASASK